MDRKRVYPFYVRKFLNRPRFQSGAHVIASIEKEVSTWFNKKTNKQVTDVHWYYTLRISDCDRVVSFDLSDHNEAERQNTLHKLDTLIETLTNFRAAVAKSYEAPGNARDC